MTGAWAGAIIHILDGLGVCVLTSQEKWLKMKGILAKRKLMLKVQSPKLSHKELVADWGFLVYVTRTYPGMVPYLKGFHFTIEMWRGGREVEGWKCKEGNDLSIGSNNSLGSLDDTRVGGHGQDLNRAASFTMGGSGDEDEAAACHQIGLKSDQEHAYAP
ncbi:hypothetical protein ACHAXA_008388 [Cyclostephanos tholiformis]|uniref:Uncharacterized protein n=1 Tax=Cyclostephanos tholiformis TaxID=382380 RepID=A0ABD3RVT0_9STRA